MSFDGHQEGTYEADLTRPDVSEWCDGSWTVAQASVRCLALRSQGSRFGRDKAAQADHTLAAVEVIRLVTRAEQTGSYVPAGTSRGHPRRRTLAVACGSIPRRSHYLSLNMLARNGTVYANYAVTRTQDLLARVAPVRRPVSGGHSSASCLQGDRHVEIDAAEPQQDKTRTSRSTPTLKSFRPRAIYP